MMKIESSVPTVIPARKNVPHREGRAARSTGKSNAASSGIAPSMVPARRYSRGTVAQETLAGTNKTPERVPALKALHPSSERSDQTIYDPDQTISELDQSILDPDQTIYEPDQ